MSDQPPSSETLTDCDGAPHASRAACQLERAQLQAEVAALREDHVALANVSGALCDAGGIVPAEAWRYGDAVRAIVAERDEARAALAAIRTITSTLEVHADGARCSDALAQLKQASPYGYGDLLSAIEVGVPKLLDVIRRCATEARRAIAACEVATPPEEP